MKDDKKKLDEKPEGEKPESEEVKRPPDFVPVGEAKPMIDRDEVYVH